MIFLGNLEKIEEGKYRPGTVHYMPFDDAHGLNKTEDELKKEGILVEILPYQEKREGFISVLYCNPEDNTVWYEYIEGKREESTYKEEIVTLKDRIVALEKSNAELMNLIAMQGVTPIP
ncbi:hypothetical protein [Clostridium sp.]|uniref:hypothetical protein n=1 Tax=Clostridium sp. TaxID=1506 RepID=UPI003463CD24